MLSKELLLFPPRRTPPAGNETRQSKTWKLSIRTTIASERGNQADHSRGENGLGLLMLFIWRKFITTRTRAAQCNVMGILKCAVAVGFRLKPLDNTFHLSQFRIPGRQPCKTSLWSCYNFTTTLMCCALSGLLQATNEFTACLIHAHL